MANKKSEAFIKISRNILSWQWLTKPNHLLVWMILLLSANYHDGSFQGVPVKRGEVAISIEKLAATSHLSVQQIKTIIKHLKSTGEITSQGHHDFTVFTIVNYDKYQSRKTSQLTSKQLPTNFQATSN